MEEPCAAGAAAPLRGDSEEPKQGSVLFLGGNEVKSSAVVKYSSAPPQAAFARLQEKTDLKLPPANWLRESAKLGPAGTSILGNSKKSKPFSSFGMAYDFIDSVGNDVDVVSDSENIKKLLKIPYSKSHVSMAVHRIGRTLLLDELDIQELFMRSSQTGDWTWLKEFYQRLIDQKWRRVKNVGTRRQYFLNFCITALMEMELLSLFLPLPSSTRRVLLQVRVMKQEGPPGQLLLKCLPRYLKIQVPLTRDLKMTLCVISCGPLKTSTCWWDQICQYLEVGDILL